MDSWFAVVGCMVCCLWIHGLLSVGVWFAVCGIVVTVVGCLVCCRGIRVLLCVVALGGCVVWYAWIHGLL